MNIAYTYSHIFTLMHDWCAVRSVTREEHTLKVFENRVLRK